MIYLNKNWKTENTGERYNEIEAYALNELGICRNNKGNDKYDMNNYNDWYIKSKPTNKKSVNKRPINNKQSKSASTANESKLSKNTKPLKKDLKKQDSAQKQIQEKKSPIKEIVKEKKVKKPIPTRAKNDPRQTS